MKLAYQALFWIGVVIAISLLIFAALQIPKTAIPNSMALPGSGFFTDSKCSAGCWQGLEAGKTSATTVMNILRERYSSNIKTSQYNEYTLLMASYAERVTINLTISFERLRSIEIAGTTDLTLSKITSNLGSPDYVEFSSRLTPQSTIDIQVILFYPERGFIFYVDKTLEKDTTTSSSVSTCLSRDDMVARSKVVIPSQIQTVLKNIDLPFGEMSNEGIAINLSKLSTWPGFKCVQIPFSQP